MLIPADSLRLMVSMEEILVVPSEDWLELDRVPLVNMLVQENRAGSPQPTALVGEILGVLSEDWLELDRARSAITQAEVTEGVTDAVEAEGAKVAATNRS